MTYTKTDQMPRIANALESVLLDHKVKPGIHDALLSAGVTVILDSGDHVWVSCIADDDHKTPMIEFLTVAIAGDANGPRVRASGRMLARSFIASIAPAIVADKGVSAVRREQIMRALGDEDAQRSIRVALSAAAQVAAQAEDVL